MSALPEGYDGSTPRPAQQGTPGSDDVLLRDREAKGLRLRRLGASYATIAAELGYYDSSAARAMILRALDRHVAEHTTALRTLENERLDVAVQALMGILTDTAKTSEQRVRAADALTRNSARRARLNGLDAPMQVAVSSGSLAELDDALALLSDVVLGEVVASSDADADDTPGGAGSSPARGDGSDH